MVVEAVLVGICAVVLRYCYRCGEAAGQRAAARGNPERVNENAPLENVPLPEAEYYEGAPVLIRRPSAPPPVYYDESSPLLK